MVLAMVTSALMLATVTLATVMFATAVLAKMLAMDPAPSPLGVVTWYLSRCSDLVGSLDCLETKRVILPEKKFDILNRGSKSLGQVHVGAEAITMETEMESYRTIVGRCII